MVSTGSDYNTPPTISLSGGGYPGCITGYSNLVAGSNYILPPTLTVTGGGTGFIGSTTIVPVTISSNFTVTSGGSNFCH